ncbi:cytochrome P450 [Streptomyces durmitorensis]|uniref:Cytochrome P450 n=1 Tax=Streptomyces durmitorensis TaxID=319947 RepID=A0ABY4Q8K9_9ACTN|nr:cytochrome P450 [Streptomyces durmitorensis]UQT61994.1 cytochrome P450 [Streptomyces durmitorensis]
MKLPFDARPGVALDPGYLTLLRETPLIPVDLPGDRKALLVTSHDDVRTVLADDRFSREAWHNGTLFARRSEALALVTSDAPTHTRRRRAVQSWFTHRQAAAARPGIERLAEDLIDGMEKDGSTADLVARFSVPLAYGVICDMLAVPVSDVELFLPWVNAMMSAGRCTKEEVDAAHTHMYAYFETQLAERREAMAAGTPGEDLLTALLQSGELSDVEISTFGLGLMVAGGETTTNFLSCCVLEILARPDLVAALREDPSGIPGAVDECLRWVWFNGTGGQPHVVVEEADLAGTRMCPGQVVIPLTDAANRDPSVFEDADEFRTDRAANPHMGFGYGRHMCLGAAHARVEAEVAVAALLRRLPHLSVAVEPDQLEWRDRMFIRGVWSLPVAWCPR